MAVTIVERFNWLSSLPNRGASLAQSRQAGPRNGQQTCTHMHGLVATEPSYCGHVATRAVLRSRGHAVLRSHCCTIALLLLLFYVLLSGRSVECVVHPRHYITPFCSWNNSSTWSCDSNIPCFSMPCYELSILRHYITPFCSWNHSSIWSCDPNIPCLLLHAMQ